MHNSTEAAMLLPTLSLFLALVTACPPPLNSFKYVVNDTHTTSQMIFSLLLNGDESSLSRRWTEIVTMVYSFLRSNA